MKKNWKRLWAGLLTTALICPLSVPWNLGAKAASNESFQSEVESKFTEAEMVHRPYARWWLAEGSHTDTTLKESIQELYDAGYGGVEFVTLDESQYLDDETYAWGSPEWVHDSKLIIEECERLGMSVSMTSGTHWATANLTTITPDEEAASQELGYRSVELKGSQDENIKTSYKGNLPQCELPGQSTKQRLVKVTAARITQWGNEKEAEDFIPTKVDMDSMTDVTNLAVETDEGYFIDFTADDNEDYILFAFYQYGTSENYRPSAETSYTINYFAKDGVNALIDYWNESVLTPDVQQLIDRIDECDMYMDSMEVKIGGEDSTGQLWSHEMLDEFSGRREYDMTAYLPFLILQNSGPDYVVSNVGGRFGNQAIYMYEPDDSKEQDYAERFRRDFYQTSTELYTENCLEVLQKWLAGKNMKLRAENSYGQALEISQPVKALDYVETESLEFANELDLYRGQAGAAHLFNKRYSSETGALLVKNYVNNTGYFRQMFYMQYASGIQKTVTHGYSSEYGPTERVKWPGYEGMWDMFAERFNKRQPGAVDYSEMNAHLSRIQKVLEQGVPQMDIGMLRTDYNYNSGLTMIMDASQNKAHKNEGYFWQDMTLQNEGYTYDYFSPYLLTDQDVSSSNGLVNADGVAYQALIVMQNELPYESAKKLCEWAKNGLPVVFVNNVEEIIGNSATKQNTVAGSCTGSNDGKDEDLKNVVEEIKAQKSVRTVESADLADEALKELGVYPRAWYMEENANLLSVMRKTDEATYLYVYNYMYEQEENYKGQISVDGLFQPYILDTWSGEVEQVAVFDQTDDRTILNVDLAPGDVMVYVLEPEKEILNPVVDTNRVYKMLYEDGQTKAAISDSGIATVTFADGSKETTEVKAPDDIKLTNWKLTVDSYEPGEKIIRTETTEDTGVISTEAAYTTKHVTLDGGVLTENLPWKDIPGIGETISGVGTYTTSFVLPKEWTKEEYGADFKADSFHYGTAALWVNGKQVAVNMDSCQADISDHLKPGVNEISVRVTSSLRNIMIKVGYPSGWLMGAPEPDSYGMTGETKLITYKKESVQSVSEKLDDAEKLKTEAERLKAEAERLKTEAEKKQAEAEKLAVQAGKDSAAAKNAQREAKAAKEAYLIAKKEHEKAVFRNRRTAIRKISSLRKKRVKVVWKKIVGADGYIVQYSPKSNFKAAKTVTVKKGTTKTKLFKKLKTGRKYYMRVRAYKTVDGNKIYTKYSAKKSVRVK